jgi:hypothetical protein
MAHFGLFQWAQGIRKSHGIPSTNFMLACNRPNGPQWKQDPEKIKLSYVHVTIQATVLTMNAPMSQCKMELLPQALTGRKRWGGAREIEGVNKVFRLYLVTTEGVGNMRH